MRGHDAGTVLASVPAGPARRGVTREALRRAVPPPAPRAPSPLDRDAETMAGMA